MLIDGVVVPHPAQTVELGHAEAIEIGHGDGVRTARQKEQRWAEILIAIAEANLTWIPGLTVKYERRVALCGEQVDAANLPDGKIITMRGNTQRGLRGWCGVRAPIVEGKFDDGRLVK